MEEENILLLGFIHMHDRDKTILMLDYDDDNVSKIILDLMHIQEEHNLHEFYVFKTKNGYHAYNLTLIDIEQCREIIKKSDSDRNMLIPMLRGYYGLRISGEKGKPEYYATISGEIKTDKPVSKPHLKFLKNYLKAKTLPKQHVHEGNLFFERFEYKNG